MKKSFETQFVEALIGGNIDKAIYLVHFLKNSSCKYYKGKSPLVWAINYGDERVVRALKKIGATESYMNDSEAEDLGKELLEYLIDVKDENLGKDNAFYLIDKGADISVRKHGGKTALSIASTKGFVEIARKLIDEECYIDEVDDFGNTPLILAIRNGHGEVVDMLIDKGADILHEGGNGLNVLSVASVYGKEDMVDKLIKHGADVNAICRNGFTPLMWACYFGKDNAIKQLIKNGADYSLKNNDGRMAVSFITQKETKKAFFDAMKEKYKTESKKIRRLQKELGL